MKVMATRPGSARDWTRWEIDRAREVLGRTTARLARRVELPAQYEEDLRGALTHAVRAWCRTHLRCKDAANDDDSHYLAFGEKGA